MKIIIMHCNYQIIFKSKNVDQILLVFSIVFRSLLYILTLFLVFKTYINNRNFVDKHS